MELLQLIMEDVKIRFENARIVRLVVHDGNKMVFYSSMFLVWALTFAYAKAQSFGAFFFGASTVIIIIFLGLNRRLFIDVPTEINKVVTNLKIEGASITIETASFNSWFASKEPILLTIALKELNLKKGLFILESKKMNLEECFIHEKGEQKFYFFPKNLSEDQEATFRALIN